MLYPTMPLQELINWASMNRVDYALSYPAKMLLVPTSKIHTNWLWVYKQNNTSIQDIITRPTAHTLEESNAETAPLEFQQAAIHYLEDMVENAHQAKQDEEQLLKNNPPTNPILKQIWLNTLQQRSQLRQSVSPRSKEDRRTQKLWFDSKQQRLQYKEETIAWCGGGSWAEITLHLDGRKHMITCNCLNGKRGKCRIGLSALDQTLEMLTDSSLSHLHDRLIKELGTPKWQKDLALLDQTLMQPDLSRPGEELGWRIKETKQGLEIEGVWCIHTPNGWKHRKADINELIQHGGHFQTASDLSLAKLVAAKNSSLYPAMFLILQRHPRVFIGSKSSELGLLTFTNLTLEFSQHQTGIEWALTLDNQELLPKEILAFPEISNTNIWYSIQHNSFKYAIISNQIQYFIRNIALMSKIIPNDAISEIYQKLPLIEQILPVHLSETLRGSPLISDSRPIIRVSNSGTQNLRLDFQVKPRGNKSFPIASSTKILYIFNKEKQEFGNCSRDFDQEKTHAQTLQKMLMLEPNLEYTWTITEPAEIFKLLSMLKNLPEAHYNRIEWLSAAPVIQHISFDQLRVDVLNHENNLEIQGNLDLDEATSLDLWEVLPAIRQPNPYLLVKGHVWYSIDADFRSRLRTLADIIEPSKQQLNISNSHIVTLNNVLSHESTTIPIVLQQRMREIQSILLEETEFPYILRPYQTTGVSWLLNLKQWTSGCLLADEMGLGKTIQVLRFLKEVQTNEQNKVLIIAPKSTHGNWLKELQKCLSDWNIIHYQGSERKELLTTLFPKQCLVLTYDIMVRDIELLMEFHYSTIVFDEAQYLKNPQASRAQSAKLLTSDFNIALTGTPIENSLLDLWSIFSVVAPKHLGAWQLFRKRFVLPIESGQNERLQDLQKVIDPLLLRRQKEDVAFDLPAKIEINESITLSTFERDTYDQLRVEAQRIIKENPQQAKFLVLSLLTKLRQVCCHRQLVVESASKHSSKLERTLEIVQNLRLKKRKVLIFSQFVQLLKLFRTMLEQESLDFCYLDGSTSTQQRQEEIDRFQNTDTSIFLISLKAGGSGINLTKATEVIHLDPWWNPAVEDQASDRAHRIGQTETVTVIRMVAEDTIETQILQLQQDKRQIAADLLSDSISTLSLEDINRLLE